MLFVKRCIIASLLTISLVFNASAQSAAIAIIIDDLGNSLSAGKRVINSKYPIACSILPQRPFSTQLADLANANGKEVIVHLPMESEKKHTLGNGALSSSMSKQDFEQAINESINAVPHAQGVNNHMGSLLTQQSNYMEWFMQTLANRDDHLYFVDSRTTAETVAREKANQYFIPNLERDVFLDTVSNDESFVREQVKYLFKTAREQGYALAIGHPSHVTLTVLEDELSKVSESEIRLVSVKELIKLSNQKQWQTYSSLSHKVAKN